ncbi:hypothetical protein SDJN02_02088, partial [Cucurbita argyrosperma subsp. argyrosperma]
MSLVDPSIGRVLIWIVTFVLFLSVLSGGGCLLMYITLPETENTAWLPVAGLSLVCLPWFFWFLTFLYRIISRACGFRVSLGLVVNEDAAATNNENADNNTRNESPQSDAGCQANKEDSNQRQSNSSSNSSGASRESEKPLAITTGS